MSKLKQLSIDVRISLARFIDTGGNERDGARGVIWISLLVFQKGWCSPST